MKHLAGSLGLLGAMLAAGPALADGDAKSGAGSSAAGGTLELSLRLDKLAQENENLRRRLAVLEDTPEAVAKEKELAGIRAAQAEFPEGIYRKDVVRTNNVHSYQLLDTTQNINRKQRLILEKRLRGELDDNALYVGGAATAIVNFQNSNTESKFGYLMRHPTSANQRTKSVSEAAIHSAQIQLTATMGEWMTGVLEVLYDPQQSFGAGTLTSLERNQLQMRRAYVMVGNLKQSGFYASVGKMAIPFGLTDTVNPFTSSTVWHAFGGLAYGMNAGYTNGNFSANVMAVQGGAQFRSANTPVDGSAVPSKLNNFAIDVNYKAEINGPDSTAEVGVSYIAGSAYCQDFPVIHFNACQEANPAYDVYAKLTFKDVVLQAEYAATLNEWPGTFNPTIPEHEASKVTSWMLGAKYQTSIGAWPVEVSAEFSRFTAGPSGSEWEKQDQIVLGMSAYMNDSVKLFAEVIHASGYVPLNFISGGNLGPGQTHSEQDVRTTVFMTGVNAAF